MFCVPQIFVVQLKKLTIIIYGVETINIVNGYKMYFRNVKQYIHVTNYFFVKLKVLFEN